MAQFFPETRDQCRMLELQRVWRINSAIFSTLVCCQSQDGRRKGFENCPQHVLDIGLTGALWEVYWRHSCNPLGSQIPEPVFSFDY